MISLAGMPYVPHHGAAASGDWKTIVAVLIVMAIAFGAMAVFGYRTSRPQRASEQEPVDSDRKAA
jgi:hypothetical protein